MDDAAKLSAPAFEMLESGVELAAAGDDWRTGPAATRTVRYETIIVDSAFERHTIKFFTFWPILFTHFAAGAAIAKSPLSLAQEKKHQPFAAKVEVPGEQFTVAHQADNTAVLGAQTFASHAEATAHLAATVAADPTVVDTFHVIPLAEVNGVA
jgi:hypothetical protein